MKPSLIWAAGLSLATLAAADPSAKNENPAKSWLVLEDKPTVSVPSDETAEETPELLRALKTVYASEDMMITWGGRIMLDAAFLSGDDEHPALDDGGPPGWDDPDGFEFRRARFFAKGNIYNLGFKAQYDFAGGDSDFKDVYINWGSPIGKLQVGHQKEPMSLEQLTSSRFITFMERAMVVEALTPERNTGVQLSDMFGDAGNWAIFFGKDTDDFGDGTGDGEYHTTARVTYAPVLNEDGTQVVHVGGSVSYQSDDDQRFRTRPEIHLTESRVLDTGSADSDGTVVYGAEAAWVQGPLSIQGEYYMASIEDYEAGAGPDDTDLSGWYAFVSYFLTGESRTYKAKGGKFDRIKPKTNFASPGGAWELAARYSYLDYDDGALDGFGESTGITLGVNWYMNPNARIMFNYVNNNFDNSVDEDLNAFMMRFQVDW